MLPSLTLHNPMKRVCVWHLLASHMHLQDAQALGCNMAARHPMRGLQTSLQLPSVYDSRSWVQQILVSTDPASWPA